MRSRAPAITPERGSWTLFVLAALAGLSFPGASTDGQEPSLDRLAQKCDYTAGRITSADPSGQNADFWTIAPGQTRVLAEIKGPGRIVHFRDNITSNERHHLQLHVLRIYWDGESEPSVEVPIGDFFGVGFGFTERYSSALMCIDQRRGKVTDSAANGAARNCYIPMPFARSARMTLTNEGKVPSLHWVEINYRTYTQVSPDLRYFHAQYRQGTPPPEGPYLILDAKGDGHLIGCVLSIKNNDGGWWGEGDEIVWIDGKQTIQGTGSEDYFCESYGLRTGCFPYFGVTLLEEPYITAYRWHVPDPVPFQRSIRFLIEHGNGNPPFRSGNFYYSVAYWYQTEPHVPFPTLPTPDQRIRWAHVSIPRANAK
jgi:D-arabinan exo alpha-(1,3)/(1,5)-arabinofuranosidase (non-reducing end)